MHAEQDKATPSPGMENLTAAVVNGAAFRRFCLTGAMSWPLDGSRDDTKDNRSAPGMVYFKGWKTMARHEGGSASSIGPDETGYHAITDFQWNFTSSHFQISAMQTIVPARWYT